MLVLPLLTHPSNNRTSSSMQNCFGPTKYLLVKRFSRFYRLIRQQFLTPEFTGGQFYKFLLFQRKENWSLKILIRDRCIDRKSHAHWKSSVFIFHQYLLYNNSPLFGDLQLKIKYSSGSFKTPSTFLFWHERKSSWDWVNCTLVFFARRW